MGYKAYFDISPDAEIDDIKANKEWDSEKKQEEIQKE